MFLTTVTCIKKHYTYNLAAPSSLITTRLAALRIHSKAISPTAYTSCRINVHSGFRPQSMNQTTILSPPRSGNKSLPDSSASPYTLISKNLYHHHTHTHALFSLSLPLHIYIYMSVRFTQSVLLLRSALCIPVHASGYMPTTTPPRRKAARGEIERKRAPGWLARKHLKHVILHYTRVRARGTKGGGRARVHSGNARARAYVCVYTYRQSAVSLSLSARAFCLFRSLARRVPICLYIYLLPRALAAMYFEISELVYDYAEGKLYRAETRSERNAD